MDLYSGSFAALGLSAALLARSRSRAVTYADSPRHAVARGFHWRFLVIYAFAVGIDWLQGPYLYAWYRYTMKLPEEQVARLYATGFASGAISATMTGPLMNRFGPEMGCQWYFVFAFLSLIMMGRASLPVLFLGRAFGGIATTLLFTSFESWMVTQYHALGLDDSTLSLGAIFGNMTLVSSAVAIVVGAVSEALIGISGIQRVPFTVATTMCAFGSQSMFFLWGQYRATRPAGGTRAAGRGRGFWRVLRNRKIRALGAASCCFEAAIYLFVFFWTPALQSARQRAGTPGELPLGLIFASFMCAMLIGTMGVAKANVNLTRNEAAKDILTVMLFAAWFLSLVARFNIEWVQFGAFCVFEATIGAYFPLMGFLKSEHIDDADRNLVYSMFRLPLNVLVLLVHSLDREGNEHRIAVFMTMARTLLLATCILGYALF